MNILNSNNSLIRTLVAILGVTLFALGINLFITPINLYNGGLLGICQLIRTFLIAKVNFPPNIDISGLIYYAFNIPLFFLAFISLGKRFFLRTLFCVTLNTILLSFIPIPTSPIFLNDTLASCLFGGIMAGAGLGLTLISGGSLGGTDIIGLYMVKKHANTSMGKVNIFINIFIYLICLLAFKPSIALYSIIYMVISSIIVDKIHTQNINVEVTIIAKNNIHDLEIALLDGLQRGITTWQATGSFTQEERYVLFSIMSKYELPHMQQIVRQVSPGAFIVVNEGSRVYGNYLKKL